MSNKTLLGRLALIPATLAAGAASATGVDVTATVTTITDQLTPIGLVATAVLGVFVAVKAYHWVRRALS